VPNAPHFGQFNEWSLVPFLFYQIQTFCGEFVTSFNILLSVSKCSQTGSIWHTHTRSTSV